MGKIEARPLHELTLSEAAAAIAAGRATSTALVRSCLARIALREPTVGAWEHLDPDQALAEARRRDAERPLGPLHGVPLGVKDIIDTFDMPTRCGSPIYRDRRPAWDAAAVALARGAGAVVLGKTVTTEFAYFQPGKTANPRDPRHTPGGSSSGSAAAVADRMVPAAFGTQTAGSVIRPAAFCGVVGYKPSYGAFSLAGVKSFSPSFDTLGLFARSVEDMALLRAALLAAPSARSALPRRPPMVGLCRTHEWRHAEPAAQRAVLDTAERLRAGGACVDEVELPQAFARLVETQESIMAFEAARAYAHERLCHGEQLSAALRRLLDAGADIPLDAYRAALAEAAAARRVLSGAFAGRDVLLAPSAVGEAPRGLGATGDPLFNRMWTLLHVLSLTLPAYVGPRGLPLGIQIVGRPRDDARLLQWGRWIALRCGAANRIG